MYYIKLKEEKEKPTQTMLRLLFFCLNQKMLLTRLSRRRQGLVQDHCKNEHEEKAVLGLHDASDQPLLPDHPFQLANDDFQLLFKFDPPSLLYGSIKMSATNWTFECEKQNQSNAFIYFLGLAFVLL